MVLSQKCLTPCPLFWGKFSLLFGHVKGSFTGANSDHVGFFEQADGGTIFLDELDETSRSMQSKLLRVLQEGEFFRVGENKVRKTDVRLIAAAKPAMIDKVETEAFRQDLYYRLNVVQIQIPTLNQRIEDIPLLAEHFLNRFNDLYDKRIKGFKPQALLRLQNYSWPGNVRQMENAIKQAVLFADRDGFIDVGHFPVEVNPEKTYSNLRNIDLASQITAFERRVITSTLDRYNGDRNTTARQLGISNSTLNRKLRKLGLFE